jgi:DNA-binding transcriptional regulator YiaG
MRRLNYHYEESGLDNVVLMGLEACEDDMGEEVVTIRNINGLHRAIVQGIANKPTAISGKELRFVRTELGKTQAELAVALSKDAQTIGRWERGEHPIDSTAETLIRVMALLHVGIAIADISKIASWAVESSGEPPILIDAKDPEGDGYKPLPQAA